MNLEPPARLLLIFLAAFSCAASARAQDGTSKAQPKADTKEAGIPKAAKESDAQPEEVEPSARNLQFEAVDSSDRKPIAGMKLNVMAMRGRSRLSPGPYFTDEKGKALIELLDGLTYLNIRTSHDSYPPKSINWEQRRNDVIPTNYVFKAEPGTLIGGTVVDEEGKPVETAKLSISLNENRGMDSREQFALWDHEERTSPEGRWSCRHLPQTLTERFAITVSHPDFALSTFAVGTAGNPFVGEPTSLDDLRANQAQLKLKKGITVTGLVVDAEGNGVPSARVLLGHRFTREPRTEDTDLDGRFTFEHCSPSEEMLTIQALGFAPSFQRIKIETGMKELEIKLPKGSVIKGRVVDGQGNPIPNARVSLENWRNEQTLEWNVTTDEEGRFNWNSAPPETVILSIGKQNYSYLRGQQVTPNGQEQTFSLKKALRITGKVIDAETKQPLAKFRATPGQQWGGDQIGWQQWSAVNGRNGEFTLNWTEPGSPAVKVDAPGYVPEISRRTAKEDEELTLTFELKKGAELKGMLLRPDGQPASGGEVALATGSGYLALGKRKFAHPNDGIQVQMADDKGAFGLQPDPEGKVIIAVHDGGYAEVPIPVFRTNSNIRLQPWGRIDGVLKVGKQLGTNQSVMLMSGAGDNRLQFDWQLYQMKTDDQGRFKFENVPPGERTLVRLVQVDERSWMHTQMTPIEVKPGETTQVAMGGSGRAIVGKLVAPGLTNKIDWKRSGFNQLSTKWPRPPRNLKTPEEIAAWQNSDEAKALQRKHRYYMLELSDDGSFRIEDVSVGNYELNIQTREPSQSGFGNGKEIGSLHREVVVSENSIGQKDEPIQLGTLELRIKRDFKPGDTSPEIEVKDLDGHPFKLTDYRGKPVLLHFWSSLWQTPTNEMAGLKETFEAFGKSGKIAMLGIDLDNDLRAAKEAAAEKGITWRQGLAGEWNDSSLPFDFGLNSLPAVFLIGADGKLLGRDLLGTDVRTSVEKALAAPSKQASAKDSKTQ